MGVLQDCLVRPGERVQAGQVLGRLMDQELRAELEQRTAEANDDIVIRAGQAKYAQAMNKLRASDELNRRNLISAEEHLGHKLDAETAALEIEAAKLRKRIAQFARRQTEAMVRARQFVAPHDGVVVAVLKRPGESVSISEAVFQVVDPDSLRVTGFLDVGDAWRVRAGQRVRVSPDIGGAELPIESEVFEGQVEFVDNQVSVENQTCKLTAIVNNRAGLLRSGLEARMEIETGEPVSTRERTAAGPAPAGARSLVQSSR
jgi:RND family efflux transporter MFP subunit